VVGVATAAGCCRTARFQGITAASYAGSPGRCTEPGTLVVVVVGVFRIVVTVKLLVLVGVS
jgi:hypothetical protein